jgi:hypothetical protein
LEEEEVETYSLPTSSNLLQENLQEKLKHAFTRFNRPINGEMLTKMASKLTRLIKTQPALTSDKHDVWIESLITGPPPIDIHVIVIAIVGLDKQYRALLRVWTPDTTDIGTELSRAIDYHHVSLLYDLEGGRWKNVTEVTSDFDDRSAPVKLGNGTDVNRVERWICGISGTLSGFLAFFMLQRWGWLG